MKLNNLSSSGDGSGRKLRQIQIEALDWVELVWGSGKHLALSLPVGVGKSLIAKTIQNATGAAIVTPNNTLVQQYVNTYTDLPAVIGKTNYKCDDGKSSCSYIQDTLHLPGCQSCPYKAAKEAYSNAKPAVFNPISLFHARKTDEFREYSVIVIDEAHAVLSLLHTLNNEKIHFTPNQLQKVYGIDSPADLVNENYLLKFLRKELELRQEDYDRFSHGWTPVKRTRRNKRITAIDNIIYGLENDPQFYAAHLEKNSVVIRCVKLPKSIVKKVFGHARLVLLSATLFKPDLAELLQDEVYDYLDLPSPIPQTSRPVYFDPTPFKINYMTEPKDIADAIEAVLAKYQKTNTLVHLPYSMAFRVAQHMKTPVFTHTKENKDEKLKLWMKVGGVFLGSGLYEGLDLKGDLCRLNIIVKIPYPNLGDILVRKRKALKDGDLWYAAESLKAVVQSVGRSTRGEDDYSDTWVLDPTFAGLVVRNSHWLPVSFTSSIIWGRNHAKKVG